MKIGFVLDDTLDKPDGVQQYVLSLGRWLSAQGHEIHYIASQSTRTDLPNLHSVAGNLPVRFNGNRLSIPLPASRTRLRSLLKELQLDVIHVQMPYSPLLAARVINEASRMKTAVIGTFHILPFSDLERVATKVLGVVLSSSLKKFHAIYAVSSSASQFAYESFGVRADVLPNVIDVSAYRDAVKPVSATRERTIVFLGRLVPRKGALELLRAVDALPVSLRSTLRVRIGGKGPMLADLQAFVLAHQLSDIVSFEGFVSEEEKPQFLHDAEIALFPSLGGESFGIVLIEAMAAGAGVVMGGNNPGYETVIGRWSEAMVDPRDTAAFAAKLERVLTHGSLRARIHQEQQNAVAAYDINLVGQEWIHVYSRALQKPDNVQ